jgi:hypothetical protein
MDEHLRALEAAVARGDGSARAPLLRERLRLDRLDPARAEVAAHLGDADAAFALDQATTSSPDVGPWVEALGRWGQEPCRERPAGEDDPSRRLVAPTWGETLLARASLALARSVRGGPDAEDPRIPAALEAASAWVAAPSLAAAGRATVAERALATQGPRSLPVTLAAVAAWHVSERPSNLAILALLRDCLGKRALRAMVDALHRPGGFAGLAAEAAALAHGPDAVRAAVRADLVPWLLDA